MFICHDERSSKIVSFSPENFRSAWEDIAGIEKMLIAKEDKRGNLGCWARLIYQKINDPASSERAFETYFFNSSRLSTGFACFLATEKG